jgi:hypothetical protein
MVTGFPVIASLDVIGRHGHAGHGRPRQNRLQTILKKPFLFFVMLLSKPSRFTSRKNMLTRLPPTRSKSTLS